MQSMMFPIDLSDEGPEKSQQTVKRPAPAVKFGKVSEQQECALCYEPFGAWKRNIPPQAPTTCDGKLELRCGHVFHQTCILDYAISHTERRARCALCHAHTLDKQGRYLVRFTSRYFVPIGHDGTKDFNSEILHEFARQEDPKVARAENFLTHMAQHEFKEAEMYLKGEDGYGKDKLSPSVIYTALDHNGETAMHMAAEFDDVEGVKLLLRYGANKNLKDNNGKTPLDIAKTTTEYGGAPGVIALLED